MSTMLLEQKPLVDQRLDGGSGYLSTHSFVNIFTWKDFFHFRFDFIDDHLCVFAQNELGVFLYLPPLGRTIKNSTVEKCFSIMEEVDGPGGVSRIENVSRQQLEFFPEERFDRYNKGYEYCYFCEDIVALKGNRFKPKRALYNYFVKNYDHVFVPFEKEMIDECLALYNAWAAERLKKHHDPVYVQMIKENRAVHKLALRYYQELDLVGRVVKAADKIEAYTFGHRLSDDHFCVLLEIANVNYKGLSVYLFQKFCEEASRREYKFINVMDDFGMDNIQRTKMSFQPKILEPVYTVTKKEEI